MFECNWAFNRHISAFDWATVTTAQLLQLQQLCVGKDKIKTHAHSHAHICNFGVFGSLQFPFQYISYKVALRFTHWETLIQILNNNASLQLSLNKGEGSETTKQDAYCICDIFSIWKKIEPYPSDNSWQAWLPHCSLFVTLAPGPLAHRLYLLVKWGLHKKKECFLRY